MSGFDRLLSKSIDATIRENLGDRTVQKIEERLFEKYGLSLTMAIEQFHKLDAVLREFFGAGADGLEQRLLKNVCEFKVSNDEMWAYIENSELTKVILESFGDDDKKKILGSLNDEPLLISEIIETCNIPQTSGYRKINALIDCGLLVPAGHTITPDGKRVTKYKSIFDKIRINIVKDKVAVELHMQKELGSSSVMTVCAQH